MSDHPAIQTEARASIRNSLRDPVVKMLLEHSQLTQAQLETVLADSLSTQNEGRKANRRLFRPSGRRVSRGAYNRTLNQAQNNIIRSIYTILLLGYLGLFDTPALQPFTELSDGIVAYVHEARQTTKFDRGIIHELNARLQENISALAKRQTFKDAL